TVNDTTFPVITCSPNIITNTTTLCSQVVNYTTNAADNCAVTNLVCAPASGTTFGVGTTTVTCTATDASSNSTTCTFTVTVNDTTFPVVTCSPNIITNTTT